MTDAQWIWSTVGVFYAIVFAVHLMNRRAEKRSALWCARYHHRKALQQAVIAGEGSLEFHAMQCTNCGGFHPEDDSECPELEHL